MRILPVGIGRSGGRHADARLRQKLHRAVRAAVRQIHTDEIAAARLVPRGDAAPAQVLRQRIQHRGKARAQDRGVQLHVLADAVDVLEEPHVPQHIQLVVPDGLYGHAAFDVGDVAGAGGQHRHAGAGEADLGRGSEHDHHVLVPVLL